MNNTENHEEDFFEKKPKENIKVNITREQLPYQDKTLEEILKDRKMSREFVKAVFRLAQFT